MHPHEDGIYVDIDLPEHGAMAKLEMPSMKLLEVTSFLNVAVVAHGQCSAG